MFWRTQTSYSGRHALVTGGSTGIGLALARELVQRGAHVTLLARTQSKLDAALAELRALADNHSLSVHVKAIAADTCSAKEVLPCASCHSCTMPIRPCSSVKGYCFFQVQAAIERAGRIDVLICSAGVSYPGEHPMRVCCFMSSTCDLTSI